MSTITDSTYNTVNGRYVLGGLTEVSSFALGWWEKNPIAQDPSDVVYYLEAKYAGRPDLLGYVFYGDPGLWWIIAQYNAILDPLSELVEGKLLIIPEINRVKRELLKNNIAVGGVPA